MIVDNKITPTIRKIGLATIAGNHPTALLGACGNNVITAKTSEDYSLPSVSQPLMTSNARKANIPDLTDLPFYARIVQLCIQGLDGIINDLPEKSNGLLNMQLPSSLYWRSTQFNLKSLQSSLMEYYPKLNNYSLHFQPMNNCATEYLIETINALEHYETVIYGGVDSLIDAESCMEFNERIQTEDNSEGIIPGEAAGFIAFNKKNSEIKLNGLHYAEEPYHNQADAKPTLSLAKIIQTLAQQHPIELEKMTHIVAPLTGEINSALEWEQTKNICWPNDSTLDELNCFHTLGYLGSAYLPIALALAYARLKYPYPKISDILICESCDTGWRGAVHLSDSYQS